VRIISMNYEESLEYLFPLVRHGTKLGLENITELLSKLGDPHRSLKCVHVAGSKGKGSVCAFISSILREAGYKVGTFTSPHLVDFSERIRVNWEPIPKEEVVRLVSELKPVADKMTASSRVKSPSFFEMTAAMAFKYFEERGVDLAVVEAGMGGRFDATNIVQPILAVITHLSTEHSEHLGRSLNRIAKDKAGIIKEKVPVVLSEGSEVIEEYCKRKDCDLTVLGRDINFGRESYNLGGQDFWVENGERKNFHIDLLGKYQIQNAATAFAAIGALKPLGYDVSNEKIREGFEKTTWPARLHFLQKDPIVVVDSTHDVDGSKNLIESLKELFEFNDVVLVFGALEDKDVGNMASVLGPFSDSVIATQADYKKALPAGVVEKEFRKHVEDVQTITPIREAVDAALQKANENDLVCITGSIFTASEAFAYFGKSVED
jgi:dihydrofolate synthase/folylpolyglutamate synthase